MASPNIVTEIIEASISAIPADCCSDGSSPSMIVPHTIVRTGCVRTANEVWAPGSLGNAWVIASHPVTWQEMASNSSHACPGHEMTKSICSIPGLRKESLPNSFVTTCSEISVWSRYRPITVYRWCRWRRKKVYRQRGARC